MGEFSTFHKNPELVTSNSFEILSKAPPATHATSAKNCNQRVPKTKPIQLRPDGDCRYVNHIFGDVKYSYTPDLRDHVHQDDDGGEWVTVKPKKKNKKKLARMVELFISVLLFFGLLDVLLFYYGGFLDQF